MKLFTTFIFYITKLEEKVWGLSRGTTFCPQIAVLGVYSWPENSPIWGSVIIPVFCFAALWTAPVYPLRCILIADYQFWQAGEILIRISVNHLRTIFLPLAKPSLIRVNRTAGKKKWLYFKDTLRWINIALACKLLRSIQRPNIWKDEAVLLGHIKTSMNENSWISLFLCKEIDSNKTLIQSVKGNYWLYLTQKAKLLHKYNNYSRSNKDACNECEHSHINDA